MSFQGNGLHQEKAMERGRPMMWWNIYSRRKNGLDPTGKNFSFFAG